MKAALVRALSMAGGLGCLAVSALGQTGWSDGWCHPQPPPDPPPPAYSIDFGFNLIGNSLMIAEVGLSGTVTWGGQQGPCFAPAQVMNARGRMGFMSGSEGSIQSTFDNMLAYTTGAMFDSSGSMCYATTTKNGTRTLFGANGFSLAYVGEGDRYLINETTNDGVFIHQRMDVVGDAARIDWLLRNDDTADAGLGLWFGAWTGMVGQETDATGAFFSGVPFGGKPGYVMLGNGERPPRTDQRFVRLLDPTRYPSTIDFLFGQTTGYGMRIENNATEATREVDVYGHPTGPSDASETYEVVIGNWAFLLGFPAAGDYTFPDLTADDLYFLDNPAFIQKYAEVQTPPGQTTRIVQWFHASWSQSNYSKPYAAVLDAPRLLAYDGSGNNDLTPNPFTIRVYVDNVRGYSGTNEEVPLNDVKCTIILPTGMSLEPGETAMKIISKVEAKEMKFIDWQVRADGNAFGDLKYSVKVDPIPGPIKIIDGDIQVSATPRLRLVDGANLVTTPWIFADSSWEVVLQLQQPQDFQAFDWDPQQGGYVISSSAQRAKGTWIITTQDFGYRDLGGNPQQPNDISTGAPLIQLRDGWNLIGNPYPYAFPLGQIVGVTGSNNKQSFKWQDLVQQGIVSGYLAYWDSNTQSYKYIQGNDAMMQPNTGFWIFVFTKEDFTLSFPAVYAPFLPGSSRAKNDWRQSESQWRLQLSASNNSSVDDANYVGQAKDGESARKLKTFDPPMGPTQKVNLSVAGQIDGKPVNLAQALQDAKGRKEWTVNVESKEAGSITLTWPNMSSVPRNVHFRIVDSANNRSRDMRRSSGYTFSMDGPGTREFKITAEPGGVGSALISNVLVSGGGKAAGASNPFTVSYTLTGPAITTVRILSSAGKEVYVAARGRADKQGQNQVIWTTRDSAGRSVAPGIYRVEIIAETEDGQRVRRMIPINVTR